MEGRSSTRTATLGIVLVSALAIAAPGAAPISHSGTWSLGGDFESPGGRLLTRDDGGEIAFQLECWRGAPSYNSGFIEGRFTLATRKGRFRSTEGGGNCDLEFRFSAAKVLVSYAGDARNCGFGYAVDAAGEYTRTSRKRPVFSDGDPRDK